MTTYALSNRQGNVPQEHEHAHTHLDCRLRQVVRVTQDSGDVKPEVLAVFHGVVSQFHALGATLLTHKHTEVHEHED